MLKDSGQNPEDHRLDSWKEIAAYFGRDERTVKRWEKERALPVHRMPGGGRGSVFAFARELSAWLRSSQIKETSDSGTKIRVVLPTADATAPEVAAGVRRWGFIGASVGLGFLFLALIGFTRFYKLHSVHGHLLPIVTPRVSSEVHEKAVELYLQGRYRWNKRTPEDLTQAEDDFAKASQLDPTYALAYAGTADCYNLLREYTSTPASQTFPLAIAAARKSIELDPDLSEGHRALAFALFHWNWDVQGAEREFQRALELNSNDVEAHHWYATALMAIGRFPEATEQIETARQLDPTSSSVAADRAVILYGSGRSQEAIGILQELRVGDPAFFSPPSYLSRIYFEQREYERYFDQAEIAAKLRHDDQELVSIALSRKRFKEGGEKELLEGMLQEQLEAFRQGRTDAVSVATIYAMMGRKRDSLDYLEKAYQRHDYSLIGAQTTWVLRSLKDDPELIDLMNRVHSYSAQSAAT